MTQELGLVEKEANYVNPYAPYPMGKSPETKPKKVKKKKTFRKGPSLSRNYGDL